MIPLPAFLGLAGLLFVLGILAFFTKRDLLTQFMAVEVMLNAGNLAFLALAGGSADAQVVIFFILTVAAAEAVVGTAIILLVFRQRRTIRTEDVSGLKG